MSAKGFQPFVPFNPLASFDRIAEFGQSLSAQLEKMTRLQFDAGLASTRDALAAVQALLEVVEPARPPSGRKPTSSRASPVPPTAPAVTNCSSKPATSLAAVAQQSVVEATRQMQAQIGRIAEGAPEGFCGGSTPSARASTPRSPRWKT